MLAKRTNIVNALLVLPLSYALLRQGDQNIRYAPLKRLNASQGLPYLSDVMLGIFVVAPLATGITWLLFRHYKEDRTLANATTVFSAVFGTLACLYFLWTLRY